jgi:hypothetical protein
MNKKLDMFGWCPICSERWGTENGYSKLIGIEDRKLYDGISFWQCPFCKTTWDRWTGEIVKEDIS